MILKLQARITEDKVYDECPEPISTKTWEFIQQVVYMQRLYENRQYTRAEQLRDKLTKQLDDIMMEEL